MRFFAPTLGILLFCNWVASVVGFHWAMELFADFKIEMSPLTSVAIWATKGVPLLLGAALVALTSVALARRTRIGWCFGFVICLMCDLLFLCTAILANNLLDSLGNVQGMSLLGKMEMVFSSFGKVSLLAISHSQISELSPFLLAATFVLTQVTLGALIFRSRGLVESRWKSEKLD